MLSWPALVALLAAALLQQQANAGALRLGKPAPSMGLSSSTSQHFPSDLLAHPAFKVHFDDHATVSNGTAAALLAKSREAHGNDLAGWNAEQGERGGEHHMLIHSSPRQAHLCSLTPPAISSSSGAFDVQSTLTPSTLLAERHRVIESGLSLLAPLKGTCLYHTLDWFTYSLCFGESVRQFKAIEATVGPGRVPAQDPSKDAYVLGRWKRELERVGGRLWDERSGSTADHQGGGDLSPMRSHDDHDSSNVSLDDDNGTELMQTIRFATSGVEQRYLSQVWSDGTLCDINDQPRNVEVQYHCNPALVPSSASRIALIKETTTCSYVMVVETGLICRERELKVGRERGGEKGGEAVGEWKCRRVVEGETVKAVEDAERGEAARGADKEDRPVAEQETSAPAEEDRDAYLHTTSTSSWLPSAENPTALKSDEYYALDWDEEGNALVEPIGSWAADWMQAQEEQEAEMRAAGQQEEGDPEATAKEHLQARHRAGKRLRELVGRGEGRHEGEAQGTGREEGLEELLSKILFGGQAQQDGAAFDNDGVRVHILDQDEAGQPLAGVAGLRRGEEGVPIEAQDLQAGLARAIESELNRMRGRASGGQEQQQQEQTQAQTQDSTDSAAQTVMAQRRKARLDRLAAALVEGMQGRGAEADSGGEEGGGTVPAEGGAEEQPQAARVFAELNAQARGQAWRPKPVPGAAGQVERETLAERAERFYRNRDGDGDEQEQSKESEASHGERRGHDEL